MSLPNDNKDKIERRINILQFIFIFIFAVYTVKLFAMQVLSSDAYRIRADTIAVRNMVVPVHRGEIYTSEYSKPVVRNINLFAVLVTPAEVETGALPKLMEDISAYLEIPKEQIEKKITPQMSKFFQPVEIASNVSYEKIAVLAEHSDTLNGVSWQPKSMRNYSETGSLSHVVGYVGNITRDEFITLYNFDYDQNDIIGKAGIEKQYDIVLRGKKGLESIGVDAHGRNTKAANALKQKPEPGKNVVLTIRNDIQTLVEKALGKRVGSVVVLRPTTGEILAMVSYPWYDPSIFIDNNSGAEYNKLINNVQKPLLNRAIQSAYPPGSTFKIIMTSGILDKNVIPPEKRIECPGEITYGNRVWKCHIRKPGHGYVNLRRGLAQSCDIYYWIAGRDYLGIDNIVDYSREYGLGTATGIDLPGEVAGFVPSPRWKEQNFHEKWFGGDTMNISIGQGGMLTTPLQLADMVSMTVNDGIIYQPHLLKEIRDPASGELIDSAKKKILHESKIDKRVFEQLRSDMRSVISEGTARYPINEVRSTEIAGKTGTSEVGLTDRWHSWFAAFAPYNTENPEERVVVSIIVEAVNRWEWWSPYASAIIFQGIFANQTYEEAVKALHFGYLIPSEERPD